MRTVADRARAFIAEGSGQISIVFAVTSMMLVTAVGTGIDLSRSYLALQELSQTATLACQYAARPTVIETATSVSASSYRSKVNSYVTKSLTEQRYGYTQTTANPFSYTAGGAGSVTLTSSVGTTFMQVVGVSAMPVRTTSYCFDSPDTIDQHLTDPTGRFAVNESFEANANNTPYIFFPPSGAAGTTISTPQQTFPSSSNYTGATGNAWYIMGYCLETDKAGQIRSSVAEGVRSAELDCDNGSGSRGNSSISTKVYLEAGNFEVRYNFTLRTTYPEYTYSVICGSTAADISWGTDSTVGSGGGSGSKTNQINVYLDADTSSGAPPTHTATGSITLAGSSLIDTCLYADNWIERSIRIKINSPGYYWLTFAADGNNDSYGGQVDDIRMCRPSCTDTLTDNFIPLWLTTNNTLFRDQFESPTYAANYNGNVSTQGNMNNSVGNSSGSTSGWPDQTSRGWATTPYNQMDIIMSGLQQEGSYGLEMDGSTVSSTTNRSMSRSFLLVPGIYRLQYKYRSNVVFSSLGSTVYCGATPTAANISSLSGTASATYRVDNGSSTKSKNTNIVGVFMSHSQLISQPISGGALNSQTSYLNPTGTTTTTPTSAPDSVSLTAYNSAQNNPLLDMCGYANSWQSRSAYVEIEKTNYYLLTIAALGTADANGGSIDDVVLTAVSSPYTAAPTGTVTIPSYGQQADTTITQSGYSFIANPLTPPAAAF